jgi:polyhydroxyalkanoate synthesis regulator protein
MSEMMHEIKKYANGRLYDTTRKKYITMREIEEFMRTGTAFRVVVSKTNEDISDSIIAKLKEEEMSSAEKITGDHSVKKPKVVPSLEAHKKPEVVSLEKTGTESKGRPESHDDESGGILGKVLRMGETALAGYNQKYADLWHSAMTMAEDEFEKRVRQLVRTKELSESEAGKVKQEITGFTRNMQKWLGGNVEERIEEVLSKMNLATRDQMEKLAEKIDELNKKLDVLERMENRPETPLAGPGSGKRV